MKPKQATSMDTLKKVLGHIGRYRWLVLASLLLAALTVVLQLYVPILVGRAIDGIVASGDIFVDDSALKAELRDGFGAAAAEMEGAAIAQTAVANGVPFVILRTISDLAEHQANVSFDELEQYAGKLAGDITVALLASL